MLYLHYSNRLEELVSPLARTLRAQQRDHPLARAVIVVPNRVIQEFLKLRLAQISGVAANLEFPFLRRYLARVITEANPAAAMLQADQLELVIFECLRTGVEQGDPELEDVARYASAGSKRQADRELRLFELSARAAHLLREYTISRAAMLAQWRAGTAPELKSMREAERWQRRLYLSIFAPEGRVLPRWFSGEESRYFSLSAALDAVAPGRLKSVLANPLHVFGLSYAGPEFISAFARIARDTDLHVYAMNPCMEFWEDVDSSFAGVREMLVRHGQKAGPALESEEDPFRLEVADDNLALGLWGKPGREYIRLLNELTDCDFAPHFKHPLQGGQPGALLERIQESILCREPHSAAPAGGGVGARDGSIRFLACPGIRREVEIVADSIWSLLREPSAPEPPLRFHQIALLIPDTELDAYLPHVETVFAQRYQIPLNLVDRPFSDRQRVVEAAQLLLELPKGRFNRDAVLHLVTHPAIAGAGAVDAGQWEQWCESAGVFFGADQTELEGTYIPPNYYHWDQALRRLALGVFMAPERSGEVRTVAGPDGCEYLPLEAAQDDLPGVAGLIASVRRMLAEALALRDQHLPIRVWARLLGELVRTYVNPADPEGRAIAGFCAGAIESMAPEGLHCEPVGYEVACARALECIGAAQAEQGRYAESGVAAGSFSALRSIPFRAIFALGMGETIFPQRDRRDLLDLRLARRRAGDVSPSQRDRYLFLETLLAARQRLCLSWVARDALTGQELQPSPLISELQIIIRRYLAETEVKELTTVHPAAAWDPKYFPDLEGRAAVGGLVNFDPNARSAARMAAIRSGVDQACGGAAPRGEELFEMLSAQTRSTLAPALHIIETATLAAAPAANEQPRKIDLPLGALRRYLECPLQGAAQYALGMLDKDGNDREDPDNEPLSQTYLDSVMMLRDAFWNGRGEKQAAQRKFEQALRAQQLEGSAPVGVFAQGVEAAFDRRLLLCLDQAKIVGICSLAGWERIRIGGAAEEIPTADRVLDAIGLQVPMRRRAGDTTLHVALRGLVTVSANRDRSINCVAKNSAAAPCDFLGAFLGAIALAAAGEAVAPLFTAAAVGISKGKTELKNLSRCLTTPDPEAARAYLAKLAEDLFSATNHYFLPIEAVERIRKENRKNKLSRRDITFIIEDLRDDDFDRCRSDYGPIRNARSYPPPPSALVLDIIERRFGLIEGIFGE